MAGHVKLARKLQALARGEVDERFEDFEVAVVGGEHLVEPRLVRVACLV
jgi:hypothetical protein